MNVFDAISLFLEKGGPVLLAIAAITFLMWALIVERLLYFWFIHKSVSQKAIDAWHARQDHTSWHAHKIRDKLISDVRLSASTGLILISGLCALCPLFGLLGTVTGMMEVFDVMAVTGSSNPRAMASGVSRATIPTMSGMVAALSGLFFRVYLSRRSIEDVKHLADQLEIDHA